MKTKIRLSQCMIVKNEEKNIRRALTWGKSIVCEQIVVDTGSTDKTVEIAEEMGAKVYHFDWIDDFSAAKNFAIEQATGNWIAFLDADEYFLKEDAEKIIPLITKLKEEKKGIKKTIVIRTPWINIDDEGKVASVGAQDRLFYNMPELRYKNRIHEALELDKGIEAEIFDAKNILNIYHLGYGKKELDEKGKIQRNFELVNLEVKENPENYNAWVYVGDSLFGKKKYEQAEEVYNKIIDNIDKVTPMEHKERVFCNFLKLKYLKGCKEEAEVLRVYQKSQECFCTSPDAEYWVGQWMFDNGNIKKGIEFFELSLKKSDHYKEYGVLTIMGLIPKVYQKLFFSYKLLNNVSEAVRYGVLYLRIEPYGEDVLCEILRLLEADSRDVKNVEAIMGFLSKLYDLTRAKNKFYLYRIFGKFSFPMLQEKLYVLLSQKEKEYVLSSDLYK